MSSILKVTAQCLGYAQYTSLSAAKLLTAAPATGYTMPTTDPSATGRRPNFVLLQAETQNVRWRDDGTAPTASVGMILIAGDAPYPYDGDLSKIQFIEVTASAKLNVSYYV